MNRFRKLVEETDLVAALKASDAQAVVLFKHSSSCSLSHSAHAQMETIAAELPVYRLVVQQSRALSNRIEQHFGIRHESPQVIVLHGGRAVFNASHRKVTAEIVRNAILQAETTA
jgi:bacillithiol system protein YtxJ